VSNHQTKRVAPQALPEVGEEPPQSVARRYAPHRAAFVSRALCGFFLIGLVFVVIGIWLANYHRRLELALTPMRLGRMAPRGRR